MSWALLGILVFSLGISFLAVLVRRAELTRMAGRVAARERVQRLGGDVSDAHHPVVDLSRCMGCATCVAACPEEGVLEIVHGQASVVRLARCKGIAACERECPVGAIDVRPSPTTSESNAPLIGEEGEAVGREGLFLAGEIASPALIVTAMEQGKRVAGQVAQRVKGGERRSELDLLIAGAGPAGLACALEAKRLGLRYRLIDRAPTIGGTVATYPRRKLVVTRPIELPLHGKLRGTQFGKEELMELWQEVAGRNDLAFEGDVELEAIDVGPDGVHVVKTKSGEIRATHVCLALGRRGSPRTLNVIGEGLPKVAYGLLDAGLFAERRVLVVGGGDSAVEAALALSSQPGTDVTLTYRKAGFFRVSTRNEERLAEAEKSGKLRLLTHSRITEIRPEEVELEVRGEEASERLTLPNDDVLVLAGGTTPRALLERCGVSFASPSQEPSAKPPARVTVAEAGTGLARALGIAFALTTAALTWALVFADYYWLPLEHRPTHARHPFLRPGMGAGLVFGFAGAALVAVNLAYLLRRSTRISFQLGSLQTWMTSHVATGLLAFLCVLLHAAMAPRDSLGGHAFWVLFALLVTGAIGRYLYAWVPRAANGRELNLAEVKAQLQEIDGQWLQGEQNFRRRVREEIYELIERAQWKSSLLGRICGVVSGHRSARKRLLVLAREGQAEGIPEETLRETLGLARRAYRAALAAAHFEDLRALLASWRYLHRWGGLMLVLLIAMHVIHALIYGSFFASGVG